ncbi:hypothetical protein [Mesorhizobium sp. Cs1321R2N1]|uniref:hypothetical protein n=1 Tax=Mesorhizobium sp. Cs1321R2N1 TaxID=3015174 RepID=UPI00301D3E75
MQKLSFTRVALLALRASAALFVVVAPYQLSFVGSGKLQPAAAYAKSEGGGGGDGHGGDSGSGGDGDHDGASGSGGSSGPGGGDGAGGDDNGHHGQEHVNAAGDKVEVSDDKTEVTHPDGTKEEIENGRLEVKDATGRTIVERAATPQDIARLRSL